MTNVRVKLQVVGLEHDEPIFKFDGQPNQASEFDWQQQLFDGAPHQVTATVSSLASSPRQFSPIQVAHQGEVEGIAPPLYIRFVSLMYFTAFFTVSLIIGIVLHRRHSYHSATADE